MIHVSSIFTDQPEVFKTPLQEKVYTVLADLRIPFERVDTDEVITMEDCAAVNEKLHMDMVKTLFLCDRKKTAFYLFVTRGDKPFRSSDFSHALSVPRVSFAPSELMESMLGTTIGAATIFSILLPSAKQVRLVIDRDVYDSEYYGCSDGTTTGYMKIPTERIMKDFLHEAGVAPNVIIL